jgi:hypothetical protein
MDVIERAIVRAIERAARALSARIHPTIAWEKWSRGDQDRCWHMARDALDAANYREVIERRRTMPPRA